MTSTAPNSVRRGLLGGGAAAALGVLPTIPSAFAQSSGRRADPGHLRAAQQVRPVDRKSRLSESQGHCPGAQECQGHQGSSRILRVQGARLPRPRRSGMARVLAEFGAGTEGRWRGGLPGSVAVVFYFCGHGFQSAGRNYLVPAGVDPSSEKAIVLVAAPERGHSGRVASALSGDQHRADRCLSYRSDRSDAACDDFNQISAPEGMLVFFATRAGRPCPGADQRDRNTFFAGALVDVLRDANGVTPIDDLFRIAAIECQTRVKSSSTRSN
jgi:hypothetical protein